MKNSKHDITPAELEERVKTLYKRLGTWRGLMERTVPERKIMLSGALLDRYLPN